MSVMRVFTYVYLGNIIKSLSIYWKHAKRLKNVVDDSVGIVSNQEEELLFSLFPSFCAILNFDEYWTILTIFTTRKRQYFAWDKFNILNFDDIELSVQHRNHRWVRCSIPRGSPTSWVPPILSDNKLKIVKVFTTKKANCIYRTLIVTMNRPERFEKRSTSTLNAGRRVRIDTPLSSVFDRHLNLMVSWVQAPAGGRLHSTESSKHVT